jgi:cysteine desulfurase
LNLGKITYLDFKSTYPKDTSAIDEILPLLKNNFDILSSTHHFGQSINGNVKQAREQIAEYINAETNEQIFTIRAKETMNMAIKGIAESYSNKGKHYITVSTGYKTVLDTCKDLKRKGIEITFFHVDPSGLIQIEELQKAIRTNTILDSVMCFNNKTEVIQPIKKNAVSNGFACSSAVVESSHVLKAIDLNVDDAFACMRFSLGKYITSKDIQNIIDELIFILGIQ